MLSRHLLPIGANLFWASFSSSAFLVCAQLFHTSRPSSGFREFGSRSSGEVCGCGCCSTSATWTVWAYERKHFSLCTHFSMQQLDKKQESHKTCSPRISTFCNTPNNKLIQGMQSVLSNLNCCSQKNILHTKNSQFEWTDLSSAHLRLWSLSHYKSSPQKPPAPEEEGATSFIHHCCSTPRLPWGRSWVQSHATYHWHPSLSRLSSLSST